MRHAAKILILALAGAWICAAQTYPHYYAWCEQGNVTVTINNGLSSTNKFQQSYPQCTVDVYLPGTTTHATLYSNDTATGLGNPFTANTNGLLEFYATIPVVDIRFSGAGIASPFTISSVSGPVTPPGELSDIPGYLEGRTFAQTCSAAVTLGKTLVVSEPWTGVNTATYGCNLRFVTGGSIKPANAQTATITVISAPNATICDTSASGTCVIATIMFNVAWGGTPATTTPLKIDAIQGAFVNDGNTCVDNTPGTIGILQGGALCNASSPTGSSSSTGYIISNWEGGQAGSPAQDRFARNGGSNFIAFGIGTTGDAPQSVIRMSAAVPGNAGDHIVWAEKLDVGYQPDSSFHQFGVQAVVPTEVPSLFLNSASTAATPGLTALNTVLVPGTVANTVLTGNLNTYATEIAVGGAGDLFIQPRAFAGTSTVYNTYLNYLGGTTVVGNGSANNSFKLNVFGTVKGNTVYSLGDDATTTPSQYIVQGASNGNQQLLLGYNTTSDYGSIQAIKQSTGVQTLRLNPTGGSVTVGISTTPASAAAACTAGTITWDASFIYVCISTNTWKRVGISTW